jgi:ATP-dependent exoDNAse (exonuclease V) beta subunit
MDSVYDAALAHAEKLKAELATLQNFLDLHDHFRDHFGLTPAAAPSPAPVEAAAPQSEAPAADHVGATHEIHVQEPAAEAPVAEADDAVQAHAPEAEAAPSEASEPETSVHEEAETGEEPLVIQASEGVLIAAATETATTEPLGPEATLQSVAEKLAATIGVSHPSVTGYTV